MAMMGGGGPKRGDSMVDDILAMGRLVGSDPKYLDRVAELERLKAEAEAARAEADKARLAADQERQAALAAANHNAARLAEIRAEQARLDESAQAFVHEKARAKTEFEVWAAEVQSEADIAAKARVALDAQRADLKRDKAAFKTEAENLRAGVSAALGAANEARAEADALKAQYEKKLAGAAALLAQESGEGR
jgi:fused signal recognition particle receptor